MIVIFWWCFPTSKAQELLKKEKGWPTDVGHNSWWHMKCAQHTAHNPKFEKMGYSDTHDGGHKKIKEPAHMVEGGHHLRKAPTPPTPTHRDSLLVEVILPNGICFKTCLQIHQYIEACTLQHACCTHNFHIFLAEQFLTIWLGFLQTAHTPIPELIITKVYNIW